MKSFSELKTTPRRAGTTTLSPLTIAERLQDKEEKKKEKEWLKTKEKSKFTDDKRFIIGCDPFSDSAVKAFEKGCSVFFVYDKINFSIVTEIKTKKSFQEICDEILAKAYFKNQYVISDKFIKDGRSCSIEEARIRVKETIVSDTNKL